MKSEHLSSATTAERSTPLVNTVWKFVVPKPTSTGRAFIDTPAVVEFLSVGIQDDEIVVWAIVGPDADVAMRRLIVANTGQGIPGFPRDAKFLGSVTSSSGIVWHVWDGDA